MKTSEVIRILEKLIEQNGDRVLHVNIEHVRQQNKKDYDIVESDIFYDVGDRDICIMLRQED